jgi:uncharacterized protein YdeI (YjbR/CyaY-like superfamily)
MTTAGERAFSHRTEERSVVYAYEQRSTATLSQDELKAFKKHRRAWQFFENKTPPSYKKVILHWITSAKKPETRAARLKQLLDACSTEVRLR